MFIEFWDSLSLSKRLYDKMLEPLLKRHRVTRMELDILLFLANNPAYDTAKDIIERRMPTKSHVSTSIKDLTARGYLKREYRDGNNKLAHLMVQPTAMELIQEGQAAQKHFFDGILKDFTINDREALQRLFEKIRCNTRAALGKEQEE